MNSSMNQLQSGVVLDNRYEIDYLIKSGGMGAVYRAQDLKLGCICAVKELLSYYGTTEEYKKAVSCFEREARILATLDHANLPKVSDYFSNNNRFYLIMTYIDGEDLETILIKKGNPGLPETEVLDWSKQVLEVLNYLHNQSPPIIYRDIKPSNIMLHKDGRIILIDFGIARTICPSSLTSKTRVGTDGYCPLEQYRGQPEPRSDIYSLGASMHHLLTGIPPVPFKFEPLKKIVPNISQELDFIVMKALKESVFDRYINVKEMKEEIESLNTKKTIQKINVISSKNIEDLFSQIDLFLQKDDNDNALKCVEEILNIEQNNYKALYYKAVLFSNKKNYQDSVYYFDKALSINPNYDVGWAYKGMSLSKNNCHQEGLQFTNKALEINPNCKEAFSIKGQILSNLGIYGEALECVDKCLSIDPNYEEAWENRGQILYYLGHYEEALKCYDKSVTIAPSFAIGWINRGMTLVKLERYEEAIFCLDKCLSINPQQDSAWGNKGMVLTELGLYEEGVTCLNRAIEIEPNACHHWANKGNALASLGMFEDALKCVDKALSIDPNNIECMKLKQNISKKSNSFCFITTATLISLNKPDDCYELNTFRRFRDEWLLKSKKGQELVENYYSIAPAIVGKINTLPDKKEIYQGLWKNYLSRCLKLIETGNYEEAKIVYMDMIDFCVNI